MILILIKTIFFSFFFFWGGGGAYVVSNLVDVIFCSHDEMGHYHVSFLVLYEYIQMYALGIMKYQIIIESTVGKHTAKTMIVQSSPIYAVILIRDATPLVKPQFQRTEL